MSAGNVNSVSMLHQTGYSSMHQVLFIFQYTIIGLGVAGIEMMLFGFVAKNTKCNIYKIGF